jgi:hypothetical protein
MLIKFGGVQPKLFPDWLNGSATTTVHLSGTPGQMSRPERSATRVAAGGADTAGRFPSVVCMAWPLAEFSSFRPEAKVLACGMTCSSNRLRWRRTSSARSRTAADSWPRPGLAGRSTSLTLYGASTGSHCAARFLRAYAVSPCWAPDRRSASAGSAAVSVSRMDCAVVYRSVPAPSAWVSNFECACRGV